VAHPQTHMEASAACLSQSAPPAGDMGDSRRRSLAQIYSHRDMRSLLLHYDKGTLQQLIVTVRTNLPHMQVFAAERDLYLGE
jgi:hypothetical protein